MDIIKFFEYKNKSEWIEKIRRCDWRAAVFLADLLEQNRFHTVLGNGELFVLTDGENVVSFCTLTEKDCIDDKELYPWIGFVYTAPEYRGHRYSGKVIDAACAELNKQNIKKVYLATDHIGLYEKYGFEYLESRLDVYGEQSRIYTKNI